MYVKIRIDAGVTSKNAYAQIFGIMAGITTGQSYVAGQTFGTGVTMQHISGTYPTTGIYSSTGSTSSSQYVSRYFNKRHHSNVNMHRYWVMSMHDTYGLNLACGTGFGTNEVASWRSGASNISTSSAQAFPDGDHTSGASTVHIVMTDEVFAFFSLADYQPGYNTQHSLFYVFSDFEYNQSVDDYLFSLNTLYYAGLEYAFAPVYTGLFSDNSQASRMCCTVYQPQAYNTHTSAFQNRTWGGPEGSYSYKIFNRDSIASTTVNASSWGSFAPDFGTRVEYNVIDAQNVPTIIPIMFGGFADNVNGWESMPRKLTNWYRTSNAMFDVGDFIDVNGNTFVVLGPGSFTSDVATTTDAEYKHHAYYAFKV